MGAIIPYDFITKNGYNIKVRTAKPTDAHAVLQLSYEVFCENDTLVTTPQEFTVTEEQQQEYIKLYNSDPGNCMIVAEYNKKIIGLLTFQGGTLIRYLHHGTIGMIVGKEWRGYGIGRALLSTIIEWADYNPMIEKLCLEVLASNKNARTLYKSLGFIEEGQLVNQVKMGNGHYDDLILMGKFLYI